MDSSCLPSVTLQVCSCLQLVFQPAWCLPEMQTAQVPSGPSHSSPETWLFALCFFPQFLCMSNVLPAPVCDCPTHHTPRVLKAAFPWVHFRGKSHPPFHRNSVSPLVLTHRNTTKSREWTNQLLLLFCFLICLCGSSRDFCNSLKISVSPPICQPVTHRSDKAADVLL